MRLPLKSPVVALWLFIAAFFIVAMVCVGGATRLTESGLSITEWKPVTGVMPPMSDQAWQESFDKYKAIPQFKTMNAHMNLSEFKGIYWWEWAHRLLGRVLGAVFLIPLAIFLLMAEIPARLIWRCVGLAVLCGLQGVIGWWMVSSGLETRIEVAPERLMTHLGMAMLLLMGTIWTGAESLEGQGRRGAPGGWRLATGVLLGLVVLQCLLGALVAGNRAGLIYNDWPLMNGAFLPPVNWSKGIGYSLLHDQGLVQFIHRMNAYILFFYGLGYAIFINREANDDSLKTLATVISTGIIIQALLGIATLMSVVALGLALVHQFVAICLVVLTVVLMWRVARADRVFR